MKFGSQPAEAPMVDPIEDSAPQDDAKSGELLRSKISVVNIGLHDFARNLKTRNVSVVDVDWSPPAVVDPKIKRLLAKLGG
jgi:hypothetical protein